MDLLDRLLIHDRWAMNVLFDTCEPLTDEQFDQSFDIGHENIHTTFGHIIANVWFWTDSMKEVEVERTPDWSRANLRPLFDQAHDEFSQFARTIRDEDRFDNTFTDAWGAPQTLGAAILHLILHNDEHRQEILHILNRLGVEHVPEIDHALWDFVRRGLFVQGEPT